MMTRRGRRDYDGFKKGASFRKLCEDDVDGGNTRKYGTLPVGLLRVEGGNPTVGS